MNVSETTADFLRTRLATAGISVALVMDDAFNTPTRESVQDEVVDFWNPIERDEMLLGELQSLGCNSNSEDDITDEVVSLLWSRRGQSTNLIDHANRTLFSSTISSRKEVDDIADALGMLGLRVQRCGTDVAGQSPSGGLVFMDYYLGNPLDRYSRTMAVQKVRDLYHGGHEGTENLS